MKDDPGFEEFVVAHKNRASKAAWGNDIEVPGEAKVKGQGMSDTSQKEDISDSDDENHSGILYTFIFLWLNLIQNVNIC